MIDNKLEKIEGHENYVCTVVRLPAKQKVEGLDKLVKVTVFGNDILTQKDADEKCLYLFFPAECAISSLYLQMNNEFRHTNLNMNPGAKPGFFEDTGRVKAIKFKGVISTGYIAPVNTLMYFDIDHTRLKEGDEFNSIDGMEICKKYKVTRTQATTTKESRFNNKLKRFDKLVPNQFRFHEGTSHLAKNLHQFQPEDIIVITDKWHGTSAVFSNVLIKKELTWFERLLKKIGVDVVTTRYDRLYSSRSVIKNQYINTNIATNALGGFYNEDIWGAVNKELEDKIEIGITIYGEIVGFLASGKAIQKGYDYGCLPPEREFVRTGEDERRHKFVVYRITYTKPDGNVIEFSWQQIKDYCKKYSLEYVKELYYGKSVHLVWDEPAVNVEHWRNSFFNFLSSYYLEGDCKHCVNKVPAEGICVRIDGRENYMTFKLKSKRFLEGESKQLDEEAKSGEVNIEEQ